MEKYYFENEDAEVCYPLSYFTDRAKESGLKEISILEAVPDFRNKEFVWCGWDDSCTYMSDCKKSVCSAWTKGKGNMCDHRGKLYAHGDSVTIKID